MTRLLQAASLMLLASAVVPAMAQTQSVGQSGNTSISPRNPGIATSQNPAAQGQVTRTVEGIDNKLLNQEKDRPRLPGQTPSPSQTAPGGSAAGQTPGTPP